MAIDRNKTKELLDQIDDLFNSIIPILPSLPKAYKGQLKNIVLGPALDEIEELITESRPPIMYLIGRSRHGKSSVINVLANKKVADVGDVEPTTAESVPYTITFEESFATWRVIDSRGLFETTRPEGSPKKAPISHMPSFLRRGSPDGEFKEPVELLKEDLEHYKPDVILHVISAPECGNLQKDLEVIEEIGKVLKGMPNTIIVLNKTDTLGDPSDWPPEECAGKAGLIDQTLNYMVNKVLKVESEPIDRNIAYRGHIIRKSPYIAIIPISSLVGRTWNIETLSMIIGKHLPKSAWLDFFQAQKRRDLLKKVSSSIINRFAAISAGAGTIPVPFLDLAVLIPLQILLIGIIGGLSCRSFSIKTIAEYATAIGLDVGIRTGAKYGVKKLIGEFAKIVPGLGSAVDASISMTTTYGIGKSAEAYFFLGEIKRPEAFIEEYSSSISSQAEFPPRDTKHLEELTEEYQAEYSDSLH